MFIMYEHSVVSRFFSNVLHCVQFINLFEEDLFMIPIVILVIISWPGNQSLVKWYQATDQSFNSTDLSYSL